MGWEIVQTQSGQFEARAKCPIPLDESGAEIVQTMPAKSTSVSAPDTRPVQSGPALAGAFPLPWSHYVRLMAVGKAQARAFYESETIRGGWSVRQLDRQISTQFYERTARSKRRDIMLAHGQNARPEDAVSLHEGIRDPYLLEFLNLKDEFSETEFEDAIIRHLEWFLLEMGAGFTFVARQKRIRIGDDWYRIDLLLFHRRLKCLVVIDLKIGKFSHADEPAGPPRMSRREGEGSPLQWCLQSGPGLSLSLAASRGYVSPPLLEKPASAPSCVGYRV